ncbi:hypothetical protein J3D45_000708 [Microbacterium foliorum]|uniref:hypothetical protein n=1 Tax=Microbacterium foliorum TaxID=104336 RepID=UPI00209E9A3F|nr:hypothetical protein [Microbacterium foliorum]MCP1428210.1 hypothetical protein [Microbacterium foliorum]
MRSITLTFPFTHTHEYDDSAPVRILAHAAPGSRPKKTAGSNGTVDDDLEGNDTCLARSGDMYRMLTESRRGPKTPSLTVDTKTSVAAHTSLREALERAASDAAPNGFETADVTFVGTTDVTSDLTAVNEPHVHVTWAGDATVTWVRETSPRE